MTTRQRYRFFFLFWPVFLVRYLLLEAYTPTAGYICIFCPLDNRIPFREGFLVFYVLWYALLAGMHLYALAYDGTLFAKYSRFLMFAFCLSTVCFLAFPSCQPLRPKVYPRENLLTKGVMVLHNLDTSTNVCPSEHVIGSIGALAAALHSGKLPAPWKIGIFFLSMLICISTVFLKQHSVIDILAAAPICLLSYHFSFKHPC